MLANTYYEKALSNFKTAKIVFNFASDDEEQLNIVGYHLQQAIELAIKHILALNGVPFQKTHDIDQLINIADLNNIELYLPDYIKEKADTVCLFFYDPNFFGEKKIMNGIKMLKKKAYEIQLKHIVCVLNIGKGRMKIFSYDIEKIKD